MDDRAAGEVERAGLEQPAVDRPDPVRDRRVDEDRPEDREEDERAESLALGEGARDERGRDGREHHLEPGEEDEGDRDGVDRARLESDVRESDVVEAADQAQAPDISPEREAEPDEDPHDADEGQAEEAVHDRREDVLAPDQAAVEQRQTRQHDHDQRGGCQHPRGISAVHSNLRVGPMARPGLIGRLRIGLGAVAHAAGPLRMRFGVAVHCAMAPRLRAGTAHAQGVAPARGDLRQMYVARNVRRPVACPDLSIGGRPRTNPWPGRDLRSDSGSEARLAFRQRIIWRTWCTLDYVPAITLSDPTPDWMSMSTRFSAVA